MRELLFPPNKVILPLPWGSPLLPLPLQDECCCSASMKSGPEGLAALVLSVQSLLSYKKSF